MARRKINKRTKQQPTAKLNTNATLSKMEKSFHQIPLKLASLLNKEITSLKKKQSKLKNTIDKSNLQIKKLEKRLSMTGKAKGAEGKKQIKVAQKKLNEAIKIHNALTQQSEKSSISLDSSIKLHAKYVALNKHLDTFAKEWAKQSKPVNKKSESKKNARSESAKKPETTQNEEAMIDQPQDQVHHEEALVPEMMS